MKADRKDDKTTNRTRTATMLRGQPTPDPAYSSNDNSCSRMTSSNFPPYLHPSTVPPPRDAPASSRTNSIPSSIRLNSYDVLLLPRRSADDPLRFAPGNHVGNQRFRITLSLFRERYLQSYIFGDEYECVSIAQEVLSTVCDKCIPNGRFFELGSDMRLRPLDRDSAPTIVMIRNALKNEPRDTVHRSMQRSTKRVCRRTSASGFELLCQAVAAENKLPVPEDDNFVASPNRFDVVCHANGLDISHNSHTGNNRLKVMMDIRMKSYETSDKEGKLRIAEEVVSSILDDASGHFLQREHFGGASGKYKILSREKAIAYINTALKTANENKQRASLVHKQQFRKAEAHHLVSGKHKRAILGRVEKKRQGMEKCNGGSNNSLHDLSLTPPPTTLNSLPKRKVPRRLSFVSRAA